jgi:hypothetical protein
LTAFFLGYLTDAPEALDWLNERLAQDAKEGKIVVGQRK